MDYNYLVNNVSSVIIYNLLQRGELDFDKYVIEALRSDRDDVLLDLEPYLSIHDVTDMAAVAIEYNAIDLARRLIYLRPYVDRDVLIMAAEISYNDFLVPELSSIHP
jgi:hypothetical protein